MTRLDTQLNRVPVRLLRVWREAPGHPNYEVSPAGTVRRRAAGQGTRVGRVVKRTIGRSGYWTVRIDGTTVSVHRLVALAYIGPQPSVTHEVNHKDRNRLNPHVKNLEWATRSENNRHAYANGAQAAAGEQKPNRKLSWSDVREIRQSTDTHRNLGKRYGVTHGVIGRIKRGEDWKP